jgi:hypothetical protein
VVVQLKPKVLTTASMKFIGQAFNSLTNLHRSISPGH